MVADGAGFGGFGLIWFWVILVWVCWNFVGLILGLALILVWVWLLGSTKREMEERKRPVVGSRERHAEEEKKNRGREKRKNK